jgi:membrane associated rhomboid family serine protease
MNSNKILQQFHATFGVFMVIFYLGVGTFFLFFAPGIFIGMNKAIFGIMGTVFLFYGSYRAYVTYKQIVAAFFTKDNDED